MRITVLDVYHAPSAYTDEFQSVDEAIMTILGAWLDDPAEPQAYALLDADGHTVAFVMQGDRTRDLAHVVTANGVMESYRIYDYVEAATEEHFLKVERVGRKVSTTEVTCR